jgi:hypothetical protein
MAIFNNRLNKSALSIQLALCLLTQSASADIDYAGSWRLSNLLMHAQVLNRDLVNLSDIGLRLMAEGDLSQWLSLEVHTLGALSYEMNNVSNVLYANVSSGRNNRLTTASTSWENNGGWAAHADIDRLNLRLSLPWADFTIGRQAITLGSAYFWNPLDVFRPFGSTTFDREYKTGVDAIRMDIPVTNFWNTTFIYAAGAEGSMLPKRGHSLARVYASMHGFDITVQISYEHERAMIISNEGSAMTVDYSAVLNLGGGISGEIGIFPIRLEMMMLRVDPAAPTATTAVALSESTEPVFQSTHNSLTIVTGSGYRFSDDLSIDIEHLYAGTVEGETLTRGYILQAHGLSRQASPHVTASLLRYQIHPLVQLSLATLFDWSGPSMLFQGHINCSISDEIEFLLSGIVPYDPKLTAQPGEFAVYPTAVFAQAKGYF